MARFKYSPLPNIESIEDVSRYLNTIYARLSPGDMIVPRVITIPGWDMDADATKTISLPNDFNSTAWKRVIHITVMIINDAGTEKVSGNQGFDVMKNDSTNITLTRTAGGQFDDAAYDDDTIDRGEVTLWLTT